MNSKQLWSKLIGEKNLDENTTMEIVLDKPIESSIGTITKLYKKDNDIHMDVNVKKVTETPKFYGRLTTR
jgi:hypothetical protein